MISNIPDQHAPIPVTLIGGFLGSGKTSLLNHVLSENHGIRAAVLVNDFGAVNIDAKLVVGVEGETISLANGCICCTIRDDLVEACLGLLKRPERPEHVLIELSGISDPVPVLNTFMETELGSFFSLCSTLAVVDAEQFFQELETADELVRVQIAAADLVVINKVELADSATISKVRKKIQKLGSGSGVVEVNYGRVPLELIFNVATRPFEAWGQTPNSSQTGHSFATWHWTSEHPLSLPRLREVLGTLPDGIYRAKGFLCLEEMPTNRYILQLVGRRYTLEESDTWQTECPVSEIVLIGDQNGMSADALHTAFDSSIGTGNEAESPLLKLTNLLFNE